MELIHDTSVQGSGRPRAGLLVVNDRAPDSCSGVRAWKRALHMLVDVIAPRPALPGECRQLFGRCNVRADNPTLEIRNTVIILPSIISPRGADPPAWWRKPPRW